MRINKLKASHDLKGVAYHVDHMDHANTILPLKEDNLYIIVKLHLVPPKCPLFFIVYTI